MTHSIPIAQTGPMRPKVLIIATTFPRWAGDRVPSFILDFANSIARDCAVHVLAPHTKGANTFETLGGLHVHRFVYAPERFEMFGAGTAIFETLKASPLGSLLVPAFVLSAAHKMLVLYLKNRYDVIHLHWLIPFGPIVALLRAFLPFRYVITCHGSDVFPFASRRGGLSRALSWLHRLSTIRAAHSIVFVSHPLRDAFASWIQTVPSNKTAVISMGFDHWLFRNEREPRALHKPLRLLYVGRLAEVKGVTFLIQALAGLRDRRVDCTLQICGDGPLRRSLEQQVTELHLHERVDFAGFVHHVELPKVLGAADILIGPSIATPAGEREGFGLVFLEAQAAGLPVIASSSGGIADIVTDGVTGLLVCEKDPSAIVDAVVALRQDDDLRRRLITNGRKNAAGYDWPLIARRYLQLYGVLG